MEWRKVSDGRPEKGRWVDMLEKDGSVKTCHFYLCDCEYEWRDALGYSVMMSSNDTWRYSEQKSPDLSYIEKLNNKTGQV